MLRNMNNIVFIADFFAGQEIGLDPGGAELNNSVLIDLLSSTGYGIRCINSHQVNHPDILYADGIIVANFANLSEENKRKIQDKDYVIYEHDHKYLANRNPGIFPDYQVPRGQIINKEFYRKAKAVFCQSGFHAGIVRKNLEIDNIVNLSGNLWHTEHLDLLEEMSKIEKTDKHAIMNSPTPHKGTQEAISYCDTLGLDYVLLDPDKPSVFLGELGRHKTLVFFPKTPETLSRVVLEARMMGMGTKTTKNIGAIHEPWFSERGFDLIEVMRKKREDIPAMVMGALGEDTLNA
jgi:hypothetical protein